MRGEHLGRALVPGRFQPPHWGHFLMLKWVYERSDEVIVVVGSAQKSHSFDNPFTAGERIEMLRAGLRDLNLDLSRFIIIPVHDIETNFMWTRLVEMLVPRFDTVVTGNPLVARLFRERGYRVVKPPIYNREEYNATRIRRLMLEGGDWKRLVPPSVAKLIEEFDGVARIREVYGWSPGEPG